MALTAGLAHLPRPRRARPRRSSSRRHCPSALAGPRADPARRRGQLPRARRSSRHALSGAEPRREARSAPLEGVALATLVADRDRAPQPRRRAGDRLVDRARRARARDVPDHRLHGAQHHRGARYRGPIASGARVSLAATRRAGAHRRSAGDRRRLDRRLHHERPRSACSSSRSPSGGASGRGRGRPLRRPPRPRRAAAPATSSAATSPGSSSCTQPGSWSDER